MTKLFYSLIVLFFITSCNGNAPTTINLIIYTDFLHPKQTYEAINEEFLASGLVDSLKIVGCPILIRSHTIEIDTLALERYNISLNKLDTVLQKLKDSIPVNELAQQTITNKVGKAIPISAFAKMYLHQENYKPELFLPKPEDFYYEDKHAVKVVLYSTKKNEKALIEFIKNTLPNYANDFVSPQWQFELDKQ